MHACLAAIPLPLSGAERLNPWHDLREVAYCGSESGKRSKNSCMH